MSVLKNFLCTTQDILAKFCKDNHFALHNTLKLTAIECTFLCVYNAGLIVLLFCAASSENKMRLPFN